MGKEGKCLIEKGTKIFIMKTIKEICAIAFDDKDFKEYLGNNKSKNRLSNEQFFELSRDFADPT